MKALVDGPYSGRVSYKTHSRAKTIIDQMAREGRHYDSASQDRRNVGSLPPIRELFRGNLVFTLSPILI